MSASLSQLPESAARQAELWPARPDRMTLQLEVTDPEVVAELLERPEGQERERFAREALRLGVLSLRMASGRVDADAVRSAGERLLSDVRELLTERASDLTGEMARALSRYFDPESGVLSRRIESLVEKDGDLDRLLESHVGEDESVLAETLAAHLGERSPIFKMLSPDEAEGLKGQLEKGVEKALREQREQIVGEFSLDRRDSALRRLVDELESRHKALRTDLAEQVDGVVKEFSLDKEDSALSRLVRRVEEAQNTITSEFSLDQEGSALSRMSRMIAELKTEVGERLSALESRRREEERTTLHGLAFEEQLGQVVAREAQRKGDLFESTGASTGAIKNCKVGDHLVELGPESPAPGARIVWEAKEDRGYDLRKALAEIEQARKNRRAQVGIFVFSTETAPEELEPFVRYGNDLIVLWDASSPETDVYLGAAYTTARALVLREHQHSDQAAAAVREVELATRAVEKQIRYLEDIRRMAETTRSHGQKIGERAARMSGELARQVERLDEQLAALKTAA